MHIVIIGNGITGITAAITIRRLSTDHQITVISSESEHFYSRTALMYLYMGHMQYPHIKPYEDWFWRENNISLKLGHVTHIDFESKKVILQEQPPLTYDKLLIATGSLPRQPNVPGQDLAGVQGFYNLQDLQQLEQNTQQISRAILVGGGLIGIELAEMLYTRGIPVTFLVRESRYWQSVLPVEESHMIENHIREHGIDLRLQTTLAQISGDTSGQVNGVVTTANENIPCQLVGMAIGVTPNVDFLKNTALEINRGVVVNNYLQTNIPNVYAAGDCAEIYDADAAHPKVEQLWYTGRMQGETVAHTICGSPKEYRRGIWFNSAKFFDIEYQTYGQVPAILPTGVNTIFWQHPGGKKAIRINFDSITNSVLGFNVLGIRYRHEVCERWLKEERTIDYVLEHLKEVNFDPEFYRRHEKEILKLVNSRSLVTPAFG